MKSTTQRVFDYLEAHPDVAFSAQELADAVGTTVRTVRGIVPHLVADNRYSVYRIATNQYMYSDTHQVNCQPLETRVLEWWENHQKEEVTPYQVAQILGDDRHNCSNCMSRLEKALSCIHRVRRGVYVWDADNEYTYQSTLDRVIDYIISKGGAASLSQMEEDLGMCKPVLCRVLSSIQSQSDRVKIRRVRYIELVKDNRK